MEDNSTILLDVNMDDLINSLKELKRQYDENTKAMQDLKKAGQEDSEEYIRLSQENKVLQQSMRGVEKQIQNEIKAEKAQEKSLVQLRARLANLQKQYDSMSGMQRMSAAGTELQQKIKALSDEVQGLEGNTGRWQRNVGNYQSALQGLSGSFSAAGINAGGLRKAISMLQTGNPVIAGVTAAVAGLAAGIKRLTEEFKENEKAQMELHETNAAIEVQTYANKRAWNDLADWFNGVWRKTVDQLVYSEMKLYGVMDRISNLFGGNSKAAENFAKQQIFMRQVAKAENDLVTATREWGVKEAKIRNEIADLRQKSYDKERYSAEERNEFLNQIEEKELYISRQKENLARREFEINKARSAMAQNSKEENDRLYASEQKVIEANTEFLEKQTTINRRRSQTAKEIENETKNNKNLAASIKEVRDKLEEIRMLSVDESIKEATKDNKALADSILEVANRLGVLKTELDLVDADKFADYAESFSDTVEDSPSQLEDLAAAFQRNAATIEETASGLGDSFGSLSEIYKTMAEDETKSEEEREAAAKKAQAWAKLQIAANAGTAVAKGVASAMDMGFPMNIGAIATTLAAILSAIAQAKALATESHAGGGVVGRNFTGATMGADNTVISARRGEMVINAKQQKQLYDIANGGTPTSLAASLAAALQAMPSPTLVYSEFADFQRGIVNLNESQKLR